MTKFKKSSGFRMGGYSYPGTSPIMKKENGEESVIDKLHKGFEKSSDEGTERIKQSKTILGGFTQAIGSLPAYLGEISTRYIKKGVEAIEKRKK